jgi:hypothetical protein
MEAMQRFREGGNDEQLGGKKEHGRGLESSEMMSN